QFENLRNGDFYFYLNDPYLPAAVLNRVVATKLSDIIKRNTKLTNLQANVFFSKICPGDTTAADSAIVTKISTDSFPKLFPNPASNTITIDLGNNTNTSSLIKIFNTNGLSVKTVTVPAHQETMQIDISKFQIGTFVIDVITGGNVKLLKLMKMPAN
ncbi:MAG TPA: T9SS type A sorting domain-containing protein, partial [Puia sp.]|nr:T9SS type A sorting domain-containing protein [Puia sp.]